MPGELMFEVTIYVPNEGGRRAVAQFEVRVPPSAAPLPSLPAPAPAPTPVAEPEPEKKPAKKKPANDVPF